MYTHTKCRFCKGDIKPSNVYEAFCSKDCKRHMEVYGSLHNYKKHHKAGLKTGSRKTSAKRSKSAPKPSKNSKQWSKTKYQETGLKAPRGALTAPLEIKKGKYVINYAFDMTFEGSASPLLTGEAIPTKKGVVSHETKE